MELYQYNVNSKSRHLRIRPFGDLQFGDKGFRKDLWERWKRDTLEDKEAVLIGMGDYSNSFRPTIDKRINQVMVDDREAAAELDAMITRDMAGIAEMLKPFKNRIVGLLEGHHYHRMLSGITSTQILCQILGVKYLGFVAVVRLGFRSHKTGGPGRTVDIFATHGCGGAAFTFSDMQNLERKIMPFWDCDIFLRGHSTKVYCAPGHPLNRLTEHHGSKKLRIVNKNRLLVNTGGFMEGYVKGECSYVEMANIPPCALGWTEIDVWEHNTNDIEIRGAAITPPRL